MTSKKGKTQKNKPKEDEKATEEAESPKEPEEPQEMAASTEAPVAAEPQLPQAPKNQLESLTYPFKVIVSPLKAFQRISAYPDFKGFLVIIVLLILASAALQFSLASKIVLSLDPQQPSLVSTGSFQDFLVSGIISSVFAFFLSWLFFAAPIILITNIMGTKGGGWRPFFIIVGYALTVFVLRTAVSAFLISTLPHIDSGLSTWPPTTDAERTGLNTEADAVWGPLLAYQAGLYVGLIFDAWLVILGAIAVRAYRGVPWTRAAIISITAYLILYTLRLFVGFY